MGNGFGSLDLERVGKVQDVLPEQQQNAEFITATGAKTHQL